MQLALAGCPSTTQQPVHGMALQSSWKWPNRYSVQGGAPGNQSKRCRSSWPALYSMVGRTRASERLGAGTELGARLRSKYRKPGGWPVGLLVTWKCRCVFILCFKKWCCLAYRAVLWTVLEILRKAWQSLPELWSLRWKRAGDSLQQTSRLSPESHQAPAASAGEGSTRQAPRSPDVKKGHQAFLSRDESLNSGTGADPEELRFDVLDGRGLSSERLEKWVFLTGA